MILLHSTLDSRKIPSSNVLPNSRSKSSLERYLPNSKLSNPLSHILLRVFALGTPTCLAFAWHAAGHVAPVKNLQHTREVILLHSTLDSRKIPYSNVLPNSRSKSSLERYLPNSKLSNPLSHILLRVFVLGTPTCLAFA